VNPLIVYGDKIKLKLGTVGRRVTLLITLSKVVSADRSAGLSQVSSNIRQENKHKPFL